MSDIMKRLQEPFPAEDIEWRVARAGQTNGKVWAFVLAYVTNRAIMNRLDNVFGVFGWQNEYKPSPNHGTMCGISVKHGDEWITKWDGADDTQIEAVKGGLSGSMKRAAVQWGIGRYLYDLTESFAIVSDSGDHSGSFKDRTTGKTIYFKWNPPKLPDWALPGHSSLDKKPEDKKTEDKKKEPVLNTGLKKGDVIDMMKGKIKNKDDLRKQFIKMIVDALQKEYSDMTEEKMKQAVAGRLLSTVGKDSLKDCAVEELETILRGIQ